MPIDLSFSLNFKPIGALFTYLVTTLALFMSGSLVAYAANDSVHVPATEEHASRTLTTTKSPTKVKGFEDASVLNDIDFSRYKTVFLLEPEITFNKYWYRDNRRAMSERDEKRIRETYARILKEQLEKKLIENTGLALVKEIGNDTLVIQARLEEFRITAPDLSSKPRTKDFVDHVGAARIVFQLLDGYTKQELSLLSDYKETNPAIGINELKQTNRVRNVRDFQLLFGRWAKRLSQFIQA